MISRSPLPLSSGSSSGVGGSLLCVIWLMTIAWPSLPRAAHGFSTGSRFPGLFAAVGGGGVTGAGEGSECRRENVTLSAYLATCSALLALKACLQTPRVDSQPPVGQPTCRDQPLLAHDGG